MAATTTITSQDLLDLELDSNGDLVVDPVNGLMFVRGIKAVAQLLRIAILLRFSEWFLNQDAGVHYERYLGVKGFNKDAFLSEIVETAMGVVCIVGVSSCTVDFDPQTRNASCSINCQVQFVDTGVLTTGNIEVSSG